MNPFEWREGELHADDVPLAEIAAAAGTPTYVYSAMAIRTAYRRLHDAFSPLGAHLHYAVKACPNTNLLKLLRSLGAGMDVVSGGEMERAWLSGTPMSDIVFAGVGKTSAEVRAALDGRFSPVRGDVAQFGRSDPADRGPVGIINIESESELERVAEIAAELGVTARFCLRVNPNVDPKTHEYTTTGKKENKFGIDAIEIASVLDRWRGRPGLEFAGLHVHIGSPVPEVQPFVEAVGVMLRLIDELAARGHQTKAFDLGGGWPVPYTEGSVPPLEAYAEAIVPLLKSRADAGLEIVLEPGRSILANSGLLLARVQHIKKGRAKTFVMCDAGMQTLIRPALYRAFHFVWPVAWSAAPPRWLEESDVPGLIACDLVGPICETGDFLARDRKLPEMKQGDLVAIFSAGAYGMSMVSNYNDHGRPAEVLVDGGQATMIAERQSLAALLATETHPRGLDLGGR
jgi:diaminopimelate decarboxylase